jgi:hypothetical protein
MFDERKEFDVVLNLLVAHVQVAALQLGIDFLMHSTAHCMFTYHELRSDKGKVVPAPFFNRTPCHEGVLGEQVYSSTHY